MQYDLALVTGVLILMLAALSVVPAFSGERSFRGPTMLFFVGGGLVLYAIMMSPSGYRPEELPDVVLRVIAGFIR